MVLENCSELVTSLAIIGGTALYALMGILVAAIISALTENWPKSDREFFTVLGGVMWPFAIIVGMIYLVGMWILFPLIGATRRQVDDVESRLNDRIDSRCSGYVDLSDDCDMFEIDTAFKVGDVITGIVPQTDYSGNVMSYKHLYQGCRCRVLSIDCNNSMEVILIGHKDKEAHAHKIGEIFTAPARNFTLVKKTAKKRKVTKKKAKR